MPNHTLLSINVTSFTKYRDDDTETRSIQLKLNRVPSSRLNCTCEFATGDNWFVSLATVQGSELICPVPLDMPLLNSLILRIRTRFIQELSSSQKANLNASLTGVDSYNFTSVNEMRIAIR